MKINKKVTLSLLAIGMLACVASAGTWAYFQNTVLSNGNGIRTATLVTQYSTDKGINWNTVPEPSGSATISNVKLNIIPSNSDTYKPAQNLWIRCPKINKQKAKVHVAIKSDNTPVNVIPGLRIYIGGRKIYDGDAWNGYLDDIIKNGFTDGDPIYPSDSEPRKYDVTYQFDDLTNQNQYESKDVTFDITVTVKATK